METFNKLSEELQGMVAEHLNGGAPLHTPAQRELFCSLPPDLQRKVLTDAFTSDDVRDSYNRMCRPSSGCQLRFSLYGFFHWPGALEECDHYRLHGMCSRCKEKKDRRLARRRERLRGRALLQQAWMNDDERAIDEHWHWCRVDSDYDNQSDSPDTHAIWEMMHEDELRQQREINEEMLP